MLVSCVRALLITISNATCRDRPSLSLYWHDLLIALHAKKKKCELKRKVKKNNSQPFAITVKEENEMV